MLLTNYSIGSEITSMWKLEECQGETSSQGNKMILLSLLILTNNHASSNKLVTRIPYCILYSKNLLSHCFIEKLMMYLKLMRSVLDRITKLSLLSHICTKLMDSK